MPVRAFNTKPTLGIWQKRMFRAASVASMSNSLVLDDNLHKSRVDRKCVVEGKSVVASVGRGGGRVG